MTAVAVMDAQQRGPVTDTQLRTVEPGDAAPQLPGGARAGA
jgi:hypothetical protein